MDLVSYSFDDGVAVLRLDDGKANVISPAMLDALNGALDRAEGDGAIVVLTGREGVFSGGFDLNVFKTGGLAALGMLRGGFELSARLLAFPRPVVAACSGHAIAMGSFLLLSCDYRLGAAGDFRIQANEVAIGLTMPHAALAICRQRLNQAHFDRATLLSERYDPEGAVAAGFLDRVVPADALMDEATTYASALGTLDPDAHRKSKLRARDDALWAIRKGISADVRDLSVLGIKRMLEKRFG